MRNIDKIKQIEDVNEFVETILNLETNFCEYPIGICFKELKGCNCKKCFKQWLLQEVTND